MLKQQDAKYKRVALLAIKRIKYILDTKEHFMHQQREKGKVLRNQTQEQKKMLYAARGQSQGEAGRSNALTASRGSRSIPRFLNFRRPPKNDAQETPSA